MSRFIKPNVFYINVLFLFFRMNQAQHLSVSLDFQGYLVCQIPADALEVELKIKTNGVSLPCTQTNSSEQRSIEHGGRPTDTRYTPEGENT